MNYQTQTIRIKNDMIAERNPNAFILGIVIGLLFPIIWGANKRGYAQVAGGDTLVMTAFVWLFGLPCAIFSIYSTITLTPYIELKGRDVLFCSTSTPWRTTKIRAADIHKISTHWLPDTTRCLLTLRLSPDAYDASSGDWTWVKRANGWVYFPLVHSSTNPHEAAKRLSSVTGIPYTIEDID